VIRPILLLLCTILQAWRSSTCWVCRYCKLTGWGRPRRQLSQIYSFPMASFWASHLSFRLAASTLFISASLLLIAVISTWKRASSSRCCLSASRRFSFQQYLLLAIDLSKSLPHPSFFDLPLHSNLLLMSFQAQLMFRFCFLFSQDPILFRHCSDGSNKCGNAPTPDER
jgi:hypothetical protein